MRRIRDIFNQGTIDNLREKGNKINIKILIFSLFCAGLLSSGAVFISSYMGADGAKSSENSLGQLAIGVEDIKSSWGKRSVDKASKKIVDDSTGSGVKIVFGGKKDRPDGDITEYFKWWVVNSSSDSLTLYAEKPIIENQIYNTFDEDIDVGGINYPANSWLVSSVREFFANPDSYPGAYWSKEINSATDNSELNKFEKKYFTKSLIDVIKPVEMGLEFESEQSIKIAERFYIPTLEPFADSNGRVDAALSVSKNKPASIAENSDLIPTDYTAANPKATVNSETTDKTKETPEPKKVWTRASGGNNKEAKYASNNGISSSPVYEHSAGYAPVTVLDKSKISLISTLVGDRNPNSDKMVEISTDPEDKEYYIKRNGLTDASLNIDNVISASNELKVSYKSYLSNSYLMVFLTSKDGKKSYYYSKNLPYNENGTVSIDVTNIPGLPLEDGKTPSSGKLPVGEYTLKAWIETPGDGIYISTDMSTSRLIVGHELSLTGTSVTFLDTFGNPFSSNTVTLKDGTEEFSFIAKVSNAYDKNEPNLTVSSPDYTVQMIKNSDNVNDVLNPKAPSSTMYTYCVYKLTRAKGTEGIKTDIKINVQVGDLNTYNIAEQIINGNKSSGEDENVQGKPLDPNYMALKGISSTINYEHSSMVTFNLEKGSDWKFTDVAVRPIPRNWLEIELDGSAIKSAKLKEGVDISQVEPLTLSGGNYSFQITYDTVLWVIGEDNDILSVSLGIDSEDNITNITNAADIEYTLYTATDSNTAEEQGAPKTATESESWNAYQGSITINKAAKEALKFRVKLKNGYSVTEAGMSAEANVYKGKNGDNVRVNLTPTQGGEYYIFDVGEVQTTGNITVSGIKITRYDVTFSPDGEGEGNKEILKKAVKSITRVFTDSLKEEVIYDGSDGSKDFPFKDEVMHGTMYKFIIKFNEHYRYNVKEGIISASKSEGNDLKINVNNTDKDMGVIEFTISDNFSSLSSKVDIVIKNIEENNYKVSMSAGNSAKIYEGKTLTANAENEDEWNKVATNIKIKNSETKRIKVVADMQKNITFEEVEIVIPVDASDGEYYMAEFKQVGQGGDGVNTNYYRIYELSKVRGETSVTINFGTEFYIKIWPKEGSTTVLPEAVSAYNVSNIPDASDPNPALENITDQTMQGAGYAVAKDSKFKFKFKKTNSEMYSKVDLSKATITFNNKELTKEYDETTGDCTWTVENVQQDMILYVNGISPNQYEIGIPPSMDGMTSSFTASLGENKKYVVDHNNGGNLSLQIKSGYKLVDASGSQTPTESTIQLKNKSGNVISLEPKPGSDPDKDRIFYGYIEDVSVAEGRRKVLALIGPSYDESAGLVYFQIQEVKSDIEISLGDGWEVIANDYRVLFIKEAVGMKILNEVGTELSKQNVSGKNLYYARVSFNKNFVFTLQPEDGYSLDGVSVQSSVAGSDKVTLVKGEGDSYTYTTPKITDNMEISISAGKYNSYQVNFGMSDSTINKSEAVVVTEIGKEGVNIVNSGTQIVHGYKLKFRVTPIGKYDRSIPLAMVGNKALTQIKEGDGYYFETDPITSATDINISQISVNNYELRFSGENMSFMSQLNIDQPLLEDTGAIVSHGSSFQFYVNPENGYDINTLVLECEGDNANLQIVDKSQGLYILNNITDDINVSGKIDMRKYTVNFEERGDLALNGDTKFTLKSAESFPAITNNSVQLNYGEILSFRLILDSKYDKSNVQLSLSNPESGKIEEQSNDAETQKKSAETGSAGSQGENAGTETTPKERYIEYTLQVTDDATVYVKNLAINQYTIDFPKDNDTLGIYDGNQDVLVDLSVQNSISHGNSYSFRIKANAGYDISTALVKSNGAELTATEDGAYYKYTLSNVSGDVKIEIDALSRMKYKLVFDNPNITFMDENGNTIGATEGLIEVSEINHGDPYTFWIEPKEGYNISNAEVATDSGLDIEELIPSKGYTGSRRRYRIKSVTQSSTVLVNNVKLNEYAVEFRSLTSFEDEKGTTPPKHISIYDEDGNDVTNGGKSTHGSKYKFRIVMDEGYTNSFSNDPKLNKLKMRYVYKTDSGTQKEDLKLPAEGELWEVPVEAVGNFAIEIVGIEINKYKINFKGVGVDFYDGSDQIITPESNIEIAHGSEGDLKFSLKPQSGFEIGSDIEVFADGGTVAPGGTTGDKRTLYKLTNVIEPTTVHVEGVKSSLYTVTFVGYNEKGYGGSNVQEEGFRVISESGKDITTSGISLGYGEKLKFKIIFTEGYTDLTDSAISLSDTIFTSEGTEDKEGKAITKAPGEEYYEYEVKSKQKINIKGIKLNTYDIIFNEFKFTDANDNPSSGGIIKYNIGIDGAYEVSGKVSDAGQHGAPQNPESQKTYKIKAEPGYDISDIAVTSSNSEISSPELNEDKTEATIKLWGFRNNTDISVSGVKLSVYKVTFAQGAEKIGVTDAKIYSYGAGRDITQGTQIYFNKSVKFRIELNEGFTDSKISITAPPGVKYDENTKYYSTEGIAENTEILITGISRNTYNIDLKPYGHSTINPTTDNFNLYEGKQNTGALLTSNPVVKSKPHGDSYTFLIEAHKGYNVNNVTVSVSRADVNIIKQSDTQAVVELTDIVGDMTGDRGIIISGVNSNKYIVGFEGTANVSIIDELGRDVTTSGIEVPYKNPSKFAVVMKEGYDRSSPVVKIGDKELTKDAATGLYTIPSVEESLTVSISNIYANNYDINFEGSNIMFLNPISNSELSNPQTAVHGGSFAFKIKPKEGYDLSTVRVTSTLGVLFEESKSTYEAVYTLNNITGDSEVKVNILGSRLEVKFKDSEGIKFLDSSGVGELSGAQTVDYNGSVEFTVKAVLGYNINTLKVYANGGLISGDPVNENDDSQHYVLNDITTDTEISAEISKKNYNINFPSIDGVTYYENDTKIESPNILVEYGERFKFNIKLSEKYDQSSVTVKANDSPLSLIDGVYTIADPEKIAEMAGDGKNINIVVDGVQVNRYKINLVENGYADYVEVSDSGNPSGSGIRVVEYGESLTFKVSPKEGYEISQMVVTSKNPDGQAQALADTRGKYTVSSVTTDKTIEISDVNKIQYTVSFEFADGVTYYNDKGVAISDPIKLSHGSNFEFSISIGDAYDDSIPIVQTSSAKKGAAKLATGRYLLSDITEDISIKVTNVTKNIYTVTLTSITGVSYRGSDGQTISGDITVGYNDDFTFGVSLFDAYTDSKILIMAGKDIINASDDGLYKITGILENKTVTVTGIEENIEVDLIKRINALSDTVNNAADVEAIVSATKTYNNLPEAKKGKVTNIDKLLGLQEQAGKFNHVTNDISIKGDNLGWNIKLVAVPIPSTDGASGRIYAKLNKEFILSLYDIYLWDMIEDKKYELPEGDKVTVTIPTPDLTYFNNPMIVHETSDGKIEYLVMNVDGDKTSFEMTSFSAVGIAASKRLGTGHSSLYDAVGANLDNIRNAADSIFNTSTTVGPGDISSGGDSSSGSGKDPSDSGTLSGGNISDKFKQGNAGVAKGSALRLLIVLIIGLSISGAVTYIYSKNNKKKGKKQ